MSYHNRPDLNPPGMAEQLRAHGFKSDEPDIRADAFRLGWAAAKKADDAPQITVHYGSINPPHFYK